ncbi:hypothetical protein ACSFCA_35380, partial [Variovorax sp. ZT5R36]|uniref:hypothetical protein n=1 Tax=Variovorax sp. ZT5R36 TaxID=3443734 RepID=UPI003F464697
SVAARRGLSATFDLHRETSSSRLLVRKLRMLRDLDGFRRVHPMDAACFCFAGVHAIVSWPGWNCLCGGEHIWRAAA